MHRQLQRILLAAALSLALAIPAFAQVMDRIVAVVGDEIVLLSELEARLQLAGMQLQIDPQDTVKLAHLRMALFQDLVDERLLLVQARRDSIKVKPEEIDEAIALQIDQIKSQLGSEQAFEEQMSAEGLTLPELKKRFRPQIQSQLLRDKLIRQKLANLTVSSKEVIDFYQAYQDSLPIQGESVRLSHLMINTAPSDEEKQKAFQQAKEILARVRSGEDFASLAQQYSQCPSATAGGDLGYFSRGEMVSEFEQAAFSLKPGEVSGLVETAFGYHIIKCEDLRANEVRVRHILIALATSEGDEQRTIDRLIELRQRALSGEDFSALVESYSQDPFSKDKGGDLGWFPLDQLAPQFRSVVNTLKINDISEPIETGSGYHLLKLTDHVSQRQITLDDDWEALEDLTRQKKISDKLQSWLDELRQEIYVDIRLEG